MNSPDFTPSPSVGDDTGREFLDLYTTIARVRGDDLSLLVLDVNGLKTANDEFGHAEGDLLLDTIERISDEIPKQLRTGNEDSGRAADLVMSHPTSVADLELPAGTLPMPERFRIGGDEFIVVLPQTDNAGAQVVAERLTETAKDNPGSDRLKNADVGVAVGVHTMKSGESASDGLRNADHDMYRKKIAQARPLTEEERVEFFTAIEHLEKANVRPRDIPKYLQIFGASAIAHASEGQINPDQLALSISD
jgi:GGDEF domain-containing protein